MEVPPIFQPYILMNRYNQAQGLEFELDWKLPDSGAGIITHVAWSPWFDLPKPNSSKSASRASILAASRMDGSVHLCLILCSSTVGVPQIQFGAMRELLPPQRINITKLAWTRRTDGLILAIARNGMLTLSIHSFLGPEPLASQSITCRHNNFSPVAGSVPLQDMLTLAVIITPSTQGNLNILLVSQLLPTSLFGLSTSNELNHMPSPPEMEIFFSNKQEEYGPKGTKSIFRIFGANASHNTAVLNLYFEYLPS